MAVKKSQIRRLFREETHKEEHREEVVERVGDDRPVSDKRFYSQPTWEKRKVHTPRELRTRR